jgi:hypothetical protein
LEGGWGVGEAEEHDSWFEEAFVSDECHLPLVLFLDVDVVVSPSYVEFREQGSILSSGYEFWNEWQWVAVADGMFIEAAVVLYGSEFTIFLFNEEEGGSVGAF